MRNIRCWFSLASKRRKWEKDASGASSSSSSSYFFFLPNVGLIFHSIYILHLSQQPWHSSLDFYTHLPKFLSISVWFLLFLLSLFHSPHISLFFSFQSLRSFPISTDLSNLSRVPPPLPFPGQVAWPLQPSTSLLPGVRGCVPLTIPIRLALSLLIWLCV